MRPFASPFAALALTLIAAPMAGGTTVVQNDNVIDFGSVFIQAGFVANERGAAWLTAPCTGGLTAVQVLWLDASNSGTQSLGDSITVSEAGTFPVPGAQLAQLVGPLMTEGFFNEFVLAPPIAITEDQTFVVDFRFFESPPISGPSLVSDVDGCQATKNGVFAIPPSAWLDLCSFGASGDFAIRGVMDCQETLIFEDSFESGDTSAWGQTSPFQRFPVLRIDPELPPFWQRLDDGSAADEEAAHDRPR